MANSESRNSGLKKTWHSLHALSQSLCHSEACPVRDCHSAPVVPRQEEIFGTRTAAKIYQSQPCMLVSLVISYWDFPQWFTHFNTCAIIDPEWLTSMYTSFTMNVKVQIYSWAGHGSQSPTNLKNFFLSEVETCESAISVRIEYRIESAATIRIRIESRIKSADSCLQLQSSMLNYCWLPYRSFVTL